MTAPTTDPASAGDIPPRYDPAATERALYERWQAAGRSPFLLETSLPGIFAAGDVRSGSIKRCTSAVGEGSMAVKLVHQYLADARLQDAPGRGGASPVNRMR